MELSRLVHEASGEISSCSSSSAARVLNEVLNRFLGWPFKAASGRATDREGSETETFASLVCVASDPSASGEAVNVPADALAAVIDVSESMDLERFRAAYRRIAFAKSLKKTPAPRLKGIAHTTTTLGIIFAIQAELPLEKFAEELDKMNRETPSFQWPDMVAVLSVGTINYAGQFPGEQVCADTLPPAEGALEAYTPPMYFIMVIRPTGGYSFNKMVAFLVAHLAIFSPGANVPNFTEILKGVSQTAITFRSYQYNLQGDLLPVPPEFYNDRYVAPFAPSPLIIEDRSGNALAAVQFLPWQDGGVVVFRGKTPLAPLLLLLGKEKLKRGGVISRDGDLQISYVLPMTVKDFGEMLTRFQRQSNMVVRNDSPKWIIKKFLDEGTQSPFVARLSLELLRLRDIVFSDPAQRDKFDKASLFVFTEFLNARAAAQQIVALWRDHAHKVSEGKIGHRQGTAIQIDETVDKELRVQFEGFLNAAARALKGMQNVAEAIGANIGFLFQKESAFGRGQTDLAIADAAFADYLANTRGDWSDCLLQIRNDVEHNQWTLPDVSYSLTDAVIEVAEPLISERPISQFVAKIVDRLACFIEEVTVRCFQMRMPSGITITEIPVPERAEEDPLRFRATLTSGGMPIWQIGYHQSSFEET